jgi:hypothetical protein
MKDMFQNIMLTLSDGRNIVATVPAFCEGEEDLQIIKAVFTEPMPLPDGFHFENAEEEEV